MRHVEIQMNQTPLKNVCAVVTLLSAPCGKSGVKPDPYIPNIQLLSVSKIVAGGRIELPTKWV